MKVKTITQASKQHNVNALHDDYIAADLVPSQAESTSTESRFTFNDAVSDAAIQQVITNYVFVPPPASVNIRQLAQNFRDAVDAATTMPQLKAALKQELMTLLRQMAQREVKDL